MFANRIFSWCNTLLTKVCHLMLLQLIIESVSAGVFECFGQTSLGCLFMLKYVILNAAGDVFFILSYFPGSPQITLQSLLCA